MPVRKARRCWLSGKELPRLPDAATAYGVCLQLLHPDGTETLYAHLQYLYVRTGETVQAGQILGTAGQTGRATGAHLHFELRRQGTACDPSALLGLSDA